jgi:hypothetical protein
MGDTGQPADLPLPRWRQGHPPARATTARLINQRRYELWADALHPESFTGFITQAAADTKPEKLAPHLATSIFYAMN